MHEYKQSQTMQNLMVGLREIERHIQPQLDQADEAMQAQQEAIAARWSDVNAAHASNGPATSPEVSWGLTTGGRSELSEAPSPGFLHSDIQGNIPFSGPRPAASEPIKVVVTGLELSGCGLLLERLADTIQLPIEELTQERLGH